MSPDGRRRSRTGWADAMEAPPDHPPAHTHRLPPLVRAAVIGLTVAVLCLLVGLGLITAQLVKVNQYVQGKGEQRDVENARLHEQQRQGMCDLLDQLPEGGLLDRPRVKYGCGPGLPVSSLTPEEQAQLMDRTPHVVAPDSDPLPPAPPRPALPKS